VLVCTDVLSRGIDVADVDWVIQFDLPSNASAFVHRCGRTARLERVGNAIVFLLPNEDAYVNFIKINQNVPLEPFNAEQILKGNENAQEICKKIQTAASKERLVLLSR
jgi:ATP-dependent RNA helicase DDX55/SPB4